MSGGILDTDSTEEKFFLPPAHRAALTQGTPGSCNYALQASAGIVNVFGKTFDDTIQLMKSKDCEG